MSWLSLPNALNRIQQFLQQWSVTIANLDLASRASSVFECYCLTLIAEAYQSRGYGLTIAGPSGGTFTFKRWTMGNPSNYNFFVATKGSMLYELRQNQLISNGYNVPFNLDVVVVAGASGGHVRSSDIHSFAECKHYRSYSPMPCAQFLGVVREVLPDSLRWVTHNHPRPLFMGSGDPSSSLPTFYSSVMSRGYFVDFILRITAALPQNPVLNWPI